MYICAKNYETWFRVDKSIAMKTSKLCYRKDDRAMRPTYTLYMGALKIFESS